MLGEASVAENRFALLTAILEYVPSAQVMADAKVDIVMVNREAERLFGYERKDLLGRKVEILIPRRFEQGHPGRREGFVEHPQARRNGAGRDLYGIRKDGTEFPVEIGLNPVETAEGRHVLSAIVDITERKGSADQSGIR